MDRFKIGDIVTRKAGAGTRSGMVPGEAGTITSIHTDGRHLCINGRTYGHSPNSIELVGEDTTSVNMEDN